MYTSKDFPAYPEESKACDELNVNFYSLFYISCMCIHIVVKSEVCSLSDHFRSQNSNFLLSSQSEYVLLSSYVCTCAYKSGEVLSRILCVWDDLKSELE